MYGSEIKRDAPKNKGIFALQVEGRFALPLTKEKLTNKKKEGRSARGQKKRTPKESQEINLIIYLTARKVLIPKLRRIQDPSPTIC